MAEYLTVWVISCKAIRNMCCLNPMRREFGDRKKDFVSLQTLRMGFTFLMYANTSKVFLQLFLWE